MAAAEPGEVQSVEFLSNQVASVPYVDLKLRLKIENVTIITPGQH